ncbi:MAG: hypothetical protein ACTMKW_01995 [Brevibacterium aurantiacum]
MTHGIPDDVSKEIARAAAAGGQRQKGRGKSSDDDEGGAKKPRKPRTPVAELNVLELQRYSNTPARRRMAAAALKTASYSFQQIAEILEYGSLREVKQDVYKALGESIDSEDMKATRNILILQAEKQLQRSTRFASAETLVDEDDNEYQNYEQLAWHHAAREDMRLLGQITGAFAPIEVKHSSVTDEDLEKMVAEAIEEFAPGLAGREIVDAEVVEEAEDGSA